MIDFNVEIIFFEELGICKKLKKNRDMLRSFEKKKERLKERAIEEERRKKETSREILRAIQKCMNMDTERSSETRKIT